MKTVFKAELHKMLRCPALWGAILIGMIACGINVVENCQTAQPWLDNYLDGDGTGYSTLSIFANWIDGLQVSLGEAVFFTIFPLLAALPYAWSLRSEWSTGYMNHLLVRESKKTYLLSKFFVVFLSGGMAIAIPIILNFIANMWFLPLCLSSPVITGGGQWQFLSHLFFTHPMAFVLIRIVTCFFWGGTLACLGMTASMFIPHAIAAVLSPFILFLAGSVLSERTYQTADSTVWQRLDKNPFQLLHAISYGINPAWYVWTIIAVLLAAVFFVYYLRGKRNEIL